MKARIPFSGFYESMWSKAIDNEEEQYFEHLQETHELSNEELSTLTEWMMWHATYRDAYRHVAQEYVSPFESFINDGLSLRIMLCYEDMSSPKYYNFETDHVYVGISYQDALILARRVGRNALRKAAKDMFTSRDGFISFYRNDPAEWGKLRDWDQNHLYCLFQAAVDVIGEDDYDWSIYEDMSGCGDFSTAFDKCYNDSDLTMEIGKLLGRRELKEELDDEQNDDGRRFPTAFKDTADYVRRYEDMNTNILNSNKLRGGL